MHGMSNEDRKQCVIAELSHMPIEGILECMSVWSWYAHVCVPKIHTLWFNLVTYVSIKLLKTEKQEWKYWEKSIHWYFSEVGVTIDYLSEHEFSCSV